MQVNLIVKELWIRINDSERVIFVLECLKLILKLLPLFEVLETETWILGFLELLYRLLLFLEQFPLFNDDFLHTHCDLQVIFVVRVVLAVVFAHEKVYCLALPEAIIKFSLIGKNEDKPSLVLLCRYKWCSDFERLCLFYLLLLWNSLILLLELARQ